MLRSSVMRPVLGALLVVLTTTFSACSDAPTGPGGGTLNLSTAGLAEQQQALQAATASPVLQSVLGDLFDTPEMFGVQAAAPAGSALTHVPTGTRIGSALQTVRAHASLTAASPEPSLTAFASAEAPMYYVAPATWGRTYVKVDGWYVWDSTRTDAPARGVRVFLYERLGYEQYSDTPVGWVDLIDNSTEATTVDGSIRLYNVNGLLVADLRERTTVTETSSGYNVHRTLTGSLGETPRVFTFADTTRGTMTMTAASFDIISHTKASFANVEASFMLLGYDPTGADTYTTRVALTGTGRTLRGEGGTRDGVDLPTQIFLNDKPLGSSKYDETLDEEVYLDTNGKPATAEVKTFIETFVNAFDGTPFGMDVRTALGWVVPYEAEW